MPSRGTADAVERVHRQLAAQLPPDCVTIILNPPAQDSLDYDISRRCRALGMTPVVCVGGGAARARNAALALASKELLVFLDDDVTATAGAVRCLLNALCRTEACVATGRVLGRPSGSTADELWRTDLAFDRGTESRFWTSRSSAFVSPFCVWQFGVGAAFAVNVRRMRYVLGRDVTFDERLSNGRFAGGTEDVDYFYSVYVAGGGIAYVADAVFEHDFPASSPELRRKCRQYAIADGAFYAKWCSRAHSTDLVRETRGWCARVARHVHARARRQPTVPLRSLLAEPVYKAVGALTWRLR
ncbi:MAG: glycosyltransferase [Mycobacterium sp.]